MGRRRPGNYRLCLAASPVLPGPRLWRRSSPGPASCPGHGPVPGLSPLLAPRAECKPPPGCSVGMLRANPHPNVKMHLWGPPGAVVSSSCCPDFSSRPLPRPEAPPKPGKGSWHAARATCTALAMQLPGVLPRASHTRLHFSRDLQSSGTCRKRLKSGKKKKNLISSCCRGKSLAGQRGEGMHLMQTQQCWHRG